MKTSFDTAHSELGFSVRHMMFAKVRGQFREWSGTLAYDSKNPLQSTLEVSVKTASIDTREGKRDDHLRSADFFDSATFPVMAFRSKRVEAAGSGKFKLVGDLTIRDMTREFVLDVESTGAGKDPWGNQRLGFSARGTIERSGWGLTWNQALEAGGVLVSDRVDLEIEVQVVQSE